MKAVVLKGPYRVACEERPTPQLTAEDQVVVKVLASGLCGKSHSLTSDARAEFQGPISIGIVIMPSQTLDSFLDTNWLDVWSRKAKVSINSM